MAAARSTSSAAAPKRENRDRCVSSDFGCSGRILTKRLKITGSTLRNRDVGFKGRIARALLENIWPRIESGEIVPAIQDSIPLAEASRARERLEANQAMGKLVLTVSQDYSTQGPPTASSAAT